MININLLKSNQLFSIYNDIDCEIFLIDRTFLIFQRSNYVNHVLRKPESLKINSIKSTKLFIKEYIAINFTIFNKFNNKTINACFIRFVYIIENFKINVLFNNNIFDLKNIVVYINKQKFIVNNCDNFSTSLKIIIKNNERINRIVRF